MAESLKERQARLAEKLKTETSDAPLQEVKPVAPKPEVQRRTRILADKDALVQFNVKLPRGVAKAIRQIALDEEKDIRLIVQEALNQYLSRQKNT